MRFKPENRGSACKRGYGAKWRKARLAFLRANPLCVTCLRLGIVKSAEVVDHIKPHNGNPALFWDRKNWQSLCKPCHDSHKQRQERIGVYAGCDQSGLPVDPAHEWNESSRQDIKKPNEK